MEVRCSSRFNFGLQSASVLFLTPEMSQVHTAARPLTASLLWFSSAVQRRHFGAQEVPVSPRQGLWLRLCSLSQDVCIAAITESETASFRTLQAIGFTDNALNAFVRRQQVWTFAASRRNGTGVRATLILSFSLSYCVRFQVP